MITSMKCAPPVHPDTPDDLYRLRVIHHNNYTEEDFDKVIKTLKTMSDKDYENSRVLFQFSMEHIQETFESINYEIGGNDVIRGQYGLLRALLKRDEVEIESIIKEIKNSLKKNSVELLKFYVTSYVEGVDFLRDATKVDSTFENLLEDAERKEEKYLKKLMTYQKALSVMSKKYVTKTVEQIKEEANSKKLAGYKVDFSALNYKKIELLKIISGDRDSLWMIAQTREDEECYQERKKWSPDLSKSDLEKLRKELPEVFEQYSQITNTSFVSRFKLAVKSAEFFAGFKTESVTGGQVKDDMKKNVTQKADAMFISISKIEEFLEKITGVEISRKITIFKNNEISKVVAKLEGYDFSVIFYEEENQTYGCLLSNEDIKNKKIPTFEEALKNNKGSSFHGLPQFVVEIKDQWVQEFYFGKQEEIFKIIDERMAVRV